MYYPETHTHQAQPHPTPSHQQPLHTNTGCGALPITPLSRSPLFPIYTSPHRVSSSPACFVRSPELHAHTNPRTLLAFAVQVRPRPSQSTAQPPPLNRVRTYPTKLPPFPSIDGSVDPSSAPSFPSTQRSNPDSGVYIVPMLHYKLLLPLLAAPAARPGPVVHRRLTFRSTHTHPTPTPGLIGRALASID
jgi:hypothetical protein